MKNAISLCTIDVHTQLPRQCYAQLPLMELRKGLSIFWGIFDSVNKPCSIVILLELDELTIRKTLVLQLTFNEQNNSNQ